MSIFGDIESVASDLYPYRIPITLALVVAFAGAAWFSYQRGLHRIVWNHRLIATAIAIPVLAVSIPFGWYTLSPLWERSYLEEESPLAVAAADMAADEASPAPPSATPGAPTPTATEAAEAEPTDPPFEPGVRRQGEFSGADEFHFGRGTALLIETAPGQYVLRFEEFSVRNGPDLFVYLSPNPGGYADGALNLEELKATDGAFNYEIPPGTDLAQFQSTVVWCRAFSTLFATAPLA